MVVTTETIGGIPLTDRARAALRNVTDARAVDLAVAYVGQKGAEGAKWKAAEAAGYCRASKSPKKQAHLSAIASRKLAEPHIRELVLALQEAVAARVVVDKAWWLNENVSMFEVCKTQVPLFDGDGNEIAKTFVDAKAMGGCLDRIGRHLGAYEKNDGNTDDALSQLLALIDGSRKIHHDSGSGGGSGGAGPRGN